MKPEVHTHEHDHHGMPPMDMPMPPENEKKAVVHNHSHDHSAMPAMNEASHSGHQHQGMMSDPKMAASMEIEIRNRFWIALALTIPIAWLSGEVPGLPVPIAGHLQHLILFLLATPVVFYCGWIFIQGSYFALMNRKLDMSVLIALGVFGFLFVQRLSESRT